ncbi:hypothetical protein [Piscibacillus halophilus]|nr:hypothetical protein [Piscibacillus halophilus]
MKKVSLITVLVITFMVTFSVIIIAEESNSQVSGEEIEENHINSIVVSVTPTSQRVQGAERANWTVYASHNNGSMPITYTLNPGDGSKSLEYTSYSSSHSFSHRYNPSGSLKNFNVTARAIYDYGMDHDYATVTWVR